MTCSVKEVHHMKGRRLIVLLAVGLILGAFSTANAALLGIKGVMDYPDIQFNTIGKIVYNATTDHFSLTAEDRTITMSPSGPVWNLTDHAAGFVTSMRIECTIDDQGRLVRPGKMVEVVQSGTLRLPWNTYHVGDVILSGHVYAFGWGEGGVNGRRGDFDFLLDNLKGGLVDDRIWPGTPDIVLDPSTLRDTGIFATAELLHGWGGSWTSNFTLDKVKGDKAPMPAPVPEPTTMLLAGAGLLGLARLRRRSGK
ncbi:MAG: PEP-CTERM sorting domain-containing protein [Pseudomonadota bacterium]